MERKKEYKKSYMQVIKEDLYPFLVSIETVNYTKKESKYTFNALNADTDTRRQFMGLKCRLKCWRQINPHTFTWNTDSMALRDMGLPLNKRRSAVVDIPNENPCSEIFLIEKAQDLPSDDMLDATRYVQEFKGTFLNDKETEMNKNKFKAVYSINISVNGNNFILTDPINPDKALETVLALNSRISF